MTALPRRKILVTSALPNANGPIHIGHMLEHIQTDIWVRFQKMRGHDCISVCGDDAHGTATMLHAEEKQMTPEALLAEIHAAHRQDFLDFAVAYDNYYTTHSPENEARATAIYQTLFQKQVIKTREITQLYDPVKKMFLADRYVKGICPKCDSDDQYGDNCEVCGATYSPSELKSPRSAISGATPVEKSSVHYFFDLPQFADMLKTWVHSGAVSPQIANKLNEWLEAGLSEWDISRDAPYFGFEIPNAANKYFYVWLDAPIGYMASFENLIQNRPELDFDQYWGVDSDIELYHFIGKDIINFHALFWIAVLDCAGYRKPNGIFTHGFITVNGKKMSKSRGTFITARTYLDHLNPEYLRYYYAAKLTNRADDFDVNLEDFIQRVNSDVVGKVVNIASRCAGFIHRGHQGQLASTLHDAALLNQAYQQADEIAEFYETREYAKAIRAIMAIADQANQYIDQHKPWALAKDPSQAEQVHLVATMGLNLFRVLVLYLKPVMPQLAQASETFLNINELAWQDIDQPLLDHQIKPFKPLLRRIEAKAIEKIIEASKAKSEDQNTDAASKKAKQIQANDSGLIDFDSFAKLDLRVGKIIAADLVENADSLLELKLDLGDEERTVFAGIKKAYAPADLIGKLTVVVANLKPKKMRFGTSYGMVLAAGPGGENIFLISPDSGAKPGMQVK